MEGSKTAFVLDDIRAQFKVFGESLDILGNEMKKKISGLRERGKEGYGEAQGTVNIKRNESK